MQFSSFFLAALSMGSALASPIVGVDAFNAVTSAVINVKNTVHNELLQIQLLSAKTVTDESIYQIQEHLVTVGLSVNSLLVSAQALGAVGVAGSVLSEAQLSAVPAFATNFQGLIVDIQAIGKLLIGGALTNVQLAQLKPELQWALSPAATLSRPIFNFISVAAPSKGDAFKHVAYPLRNIQALLKVVLDIDLNIDINISVGLGISI
ncbi:hypothetical protein F4859DRAFT_516151 [Xylaria cf. heliscus]|nr:hypothetical protein F4859DRAFT_516151 [Xylaria cf. heliscus]